MVLVSREGAPTCLCPSGGCAEGVCHTLWEGPALWVQCRSSALSPPPCLFSGCAVAHRQTFLGRLLPPVLWGPPALPGRGGLRSRENRAFLGIFKVVTESVPPPEGGHMMGVCRAAARSATWWRRRNPGLSDQGSRPVQQLVLGQRVFQAMQVVGGGPADLPETSNPLPSPT